MKKTVQNIALSTILLTILAVPAGMEAMSTKNKFSLLCFALAASAAYFLSNGEDALLEAARKNDLGKVKYLVENGANVNAKDNDGWTPLHWAASKNNLDMVKYLVETGKADVNAKTSYGTTPLYWAAEKNNLDMVKYLVENGANVNAKASYGTTPLHKATLNNNLEMVKYLVETGKADVNAKDNNGETPLHWAACNNYLEMVKYLVGTHKADVKAKDNNGETPLHWAASNNYLEMVKYLQLAEDFYDVNNKQMTFDTFAQKHLINANKVVYFDAKTLYKKIEATKQLNEQKLEEVKKNLECVELNYETDYKLKAFAEYAKKYLVNEPAILLAALTDVYNLLHLGTRAFFDEFVKFTKKYELPNNFGGGSEKEYMISCASRLGPNKDFWFKECCWSPDNKIPEIDEALKKLLQKFPIEERDRLKKEKNKILQQKNSLETLPADLKNKNVKNPFSCAAGTFNDIEFNFEN